MATAKDSGAGVPMTVVMIFIAVLLFVLSVISRKLCCCRNSSRQRPVIPVNTTPERNRKKGVDPAVIDTFPTLVYSDIKAHKVGKGALECAVCLSEFEDDELLRLLPKCDHVYHPECIDEWLQNHVTCPVCRVNLSVVDDHPYVFPPAVVDGGASGSFISASPSSFDPAEEEGNTLEVPDKVYFHGRSRSATPAVGRRIERLYSESDREKFSLRLPDHIRREVFSRNLRGSSSLVFSGMQSSPRGYRRNGEGTSHDGGGVQLKEGKKNWATRSAAFLYSFNWRSGLSGDRDRDVEAGKATTSSDRGRGHGGGRRGRSSECTVSNSSKISSTSSSDYDDEISKSKREETKAFAKV